MSKTIRKTLFIDSDKIKDKNKIKSKQRQYINVSDGAIDTYIEDNAGNLFKSENGKRFVKKLKNKQERKNKIFNDFEY